MIHKADREKAKSDVTKLRSAFCTFPELGKSAAIGGMLSAVRAQGYVDLKYLVLCESVLDFELTVDDFIDAFIAQDEEKKNVSGQAENKQEWRYGATVAEVHAFAIDNYKGLFHADEIVSDISGRTGMTHENIRKGIAHLIEHRDYTGFRRHFGGYNLRHARSIEPDYKESGSGYDIAIVGGKLRAELCNILPNGDTTIDQVDKALSQLMAGSLMGSIKPVVTWKIYGGGPVEILADQAGAGEVLVVVKEFVDLFKRRGKN